MSLLYKYFAPDRIEVLQTFMLRYTQPGAFNDPFEVSPRLDGLGTASSVREALESASDDEIEAAASELPEPFRDVVPTSDLRKVMLAFVNRLPETTVAEMERVQNGTLQQLDQSIGILSLTERRDSLLMWSHYAARHTGFVVGLDSSHSYLTRDHKAEEQFGFLRRVEYKDKRPTATAVDLTGIELFLTKSPHWEYEREWRIIRLLSNADAVHDVKDDYPIHLFAFPAEVVSEIILGCRMRDDDKLAIQKLIRDDPRLSGATLLEARPSTTDFRLELIRLVAY